MAKKATVKIEAETEGLEKGIDKATGKLNEFVKNNQKTFSSINKLNSAVQLFSRSLGGVGSVAKTAISTIKKIGAEMSQLSEISDIQIKAETQLATAAKNNPYLDESSLSQLKEYASELQKITAVGDESLLPFMAQLASAGRTQEEIQAIMSAALDVSASGAMSLESAVQNLNKTFSGLSGKLGESIPQIKELTKEELKNGKAVEVIKKQYEGMAKAAADATGAREKMQGAKGDFQEQLGMLVKPTVDGWNSFWQKVYEKGEKTIRQLNSLLDGFADMAVESKVKEALNKNGEAVYKDILAQLDSLRESGVKGTQRLQTAMRGAIKQFSEEELGWAKSYLEDQLPTLIQQEGTEEQILYSIVDARYKTLKAVSDEKKAEEERLAKLKAAEDEAELARKKNAEAREADNKTAAELKKNYESSISSYDQMIEKQIEMGKHLEEEEILRGRINVMQQGLFDLIENSDGLITWENPQVLNDYIVKLQQAYEQYYSLTEIQKEEKDALSFLSEEQKKVLENWADDTSIDSLERQKEMLEELKNKYAETYPQIADIIKGAIDNIDEAIKESVTETVSEITNIVAESSDKVSEITNGITSLVRQNNEEENEEAQAALAQQYTDGLISYEEYCEKKKQLDKKAAQEEYKLKMWEWTASFLQATANIAQGVAAALTQMPPASYIMAALTAAAGAVQIATITANKPKPPSFATGGIVPGTSYSGDRVQANVNSGEMILNAAQQKNLWNLANRTANNSGAVVNMPVTIENNSSASVSSKLSLDGIRIIVNEIVNSEMQRGSYTESMNIAQTKAQGVSYY